MIPLLVVGVCGDHEADSLIEHVYLVGFQVLNGRRQLSQQLCYERLCLSHLQYSTVITSSVDLALPGCKDELSLFSPVAKSRLIE